MGCHRRHNGPDLNSDDSWAEVGMVRELNSDVSGYVAIFEDGHRTKASIEATEKNNNTRTKKKGTSFWNKAAAAAAAGRFKGLGVQRP